ncbi:MAG: hypothetical protein HYS27_22570, partial [Deltaproteobacteria bacterium]|nr:hypothetical protein [Deltaproteobacteria bacterium]
MIGPNGGANGGADEVRDTIVPQDALPDVRDTVVPQDAPAPSPFQRDADVRVRRGLALGGGLALLVAAAALAPLVVVGALLPRDDQAARPAARVAPPVVDFGALRTAIPAAPTPQVPTVAAGAAREQPDPSLRAFARLANRVYEAREAWRKAGQAGKELFRTASVDDLGGAAFVEEMELGPRRFVWLRREAKVLAPAGTLVPDGVTMKDAGNDTGPASFDGTLEGKPVRAIRTCLFGESYCLVDVVEQATPAAAPAAAPPPDDAARLATFDAVAKREADKLAAWAPPAPATTTRSGATPLVALAAAAALALVLAGVAVSRLRNVAATVVGASARLRAAAAGRIEEHRADAQTAAELADLQAAVDEAARALGDGAA